MNSETLSKAVFNNKHFLAVALLIADEFPVFYVREVAKELGLADNQVKDIVDRLAVANYVTALPREGIRLLFERQPGASIWDYCRTLQAESQSERSREGTH